MHRFGLNMSIDFAHFGLESGMVYKGTMVVYQCIPRFNSKKESVMCEFRMDFKKSLFKHVVLHFVTTSGSENGYSVWILEARSENGCGK